MVIYVSNQLYRPSLLGLASTDICAFADLAVPIPSLYFVPFKRRAKILLKVFSRLSEGRNAVTPFLGQCS